MLCTIYSCFSSYKTYYIINGSNKFGVKVNVEAGGVLSECVTNTKTIYSFNFQQHAVEMYMEILEYCSKQFLRDSLISGFL